MVGPESRIIDVGVRDGGVAQACAAAGAHRYLGLVPPQSAGSLDPPPGLENLFHRLHSVEQVRCNNADLLILRTEFVRVLWAMRDLGHVRHVAVELASPRDWVEGHVSQVVSRVLGKVTHRGRYSCGDDVFQVFEVHGRRPHGPRHYLSEKVGVEGLIQRLSDDGLRYAVLRWFEELPAIGPGEDLDVLVADSDLQRMRDILAEEPGTIPVDIYSETGLVGTDFHDMAYYPPTLAARILDRAVMHGSGCRVPHPEDHLFSLAYHAAYHKGAESGLFSELVPSIPEPDHDYGVALKSIAAPLGRSFPAGLEEIDEALSEAGWRPPLDTLRRLAESNTWIRHRFFPTADDVPTELPEPTIFFIRERTLEVLSRAEVIEVFATFEFDILEVHDLSGPARARCTESVRGGNWGSGPFPVSGGEPVLVIVAVHYGPRRPGTVLLTRYPRLTNGDVLHAKVAMRDVIERKVGNAESFNPVHSSDDEFETWEYIKLALPDKLPALRAEVGRRRDTYRTTRPVRATLSTGRRAKVEVVEAEDGRGVVRKTFAPHATRYLERELSAMRDLAPFVNAVPTILGTGTNWFETELYEDTLDLSHWPDGRLVPLEVARQMVEVLRQIHALGADLIDAKPQNFLVDPSAGLKLVDYEFYHRYRDNPPEFDRIYAFVGVPPGFGGDVPFGEISYETGWAPYVGLSRKSLLHDPAWRQRLNRSLFEAGQASLAPVQLATSAARRSRTEIRRTRARVGANYRRWARERAKIVVSS